jgi:flavin reductase ActVB
MPVNPDLFRAALSRFPSGVTVVTSRGSAGDLHGITVSAFCSVSLEPPLVLVCIENTAGSYGALKESGIFIVNILGRGQDDVSERFSLPYPDRFEGVPSRVGIGDVPILETALVVLECRLRDAFDGGDHTIFVGEVESASIRDGEPLVYFHGNYRDLLES